MIPKLTIRVNHGLKVQLKMWALERDQTLESLVLAILASALRQRDAKVVPVESPSPPPPKATGPKDTGYSIDWDKVVPPEVIEREARERAAAAATPEEQAELNSLNAGSDVPITIADLREVKAVASRAKVM